MKDAEIKFYKEKVNKYRGTPAQVGYGSIKSQHVRFENIYKLLFTEIIKQNRKVSVLDFGCGAGYFIENADKSIFSKYTGIDAIDENIQDAKNKLKYPNVTFECINADENFTYNEFDFIIFSGPFSTTTPETRNILFRKFLNSAKVGVIGNFIRHNSIIDKYESGCFMVNPSDIIQEIDPAEYKFIIMADYMPHDFTVSAIRWEPKL